MSGRIQSLSFTTASIAGGASLAINRNVGPNWINILKVIITPSTATSPLRAEFYSDNTFVAAKRIGGYSISVSGPIIDPMEDVGTGPLDKSQLGFVMPCDDLNGFGQIHLLVYNDHTTSQTYTVTIYYEGRFFLSPGSTLSITPGNVGHDTQTLQVNDDTSTQRVEWYREGVSVATRKRGDFQAGNSNIIISASDDGTKVTYKIYGTGAANVRRTRWFDFVDVITGGVYTGTLDNQSVVVFPATDSEIGFGFRIDDDFAISGSVLTGDIALVTVGAAISSPGTGYSVKTKIRSKKNNGGFTGYTTGDTLALSNNTQWSRTEGTTNIITPGSFNANDWVEFRVFRDTTIVSSAPVGWGVAKFGIEYTSTQ